MRITTTQRIAMIVCLSAVILYALTDGIRYGSMLGIMLAVVSMVALFVGNSLLRKLQQLQEEEDEESLLG